MVDTRIVVSGIWVATMLTYLLGDVLRIFAGDFEPGKMGAMGTATQGAGWMWMIAAIVMLLPIVMVVLGLTLPYPAIRWVTIGVAAFLILFNLVGLPYKGAYDNFLIAVSIAFKLLNIWFAWKWVP